MKELEFRVDTCQLLKEIADCALREKTGVLKVPLNVFKILLARVAKRAIEINDDELHILMLKLGLYEMSSGDTVKTIDFLENRIQQNVQPL